MRLGILKHKTSVFFSEFWKKLFLGFVLREEEEILIWRSWESASLKMLSHSAVDLFSLLVLHPFNKDYQTAAWNL